MILFARCTVVFNKFVCVCVCVCVFTLMLSGEILVLDTYIAFWELHYVLLLTYYDYRYVFGLILSLQSNMKMYLYSE